MEHWKKVTYLVAVFMFLIDICPLEPYLTAYFTGPNGNVSLYEVANLMESIKSYSALIMTLLTLIISDYLLYKPVIIFLSSCLFMAYILMLGSPSRAQLRTSMALHGSSYYITTLATCYSFAHLDDRKQYQKSASITAIGLQLGKFFGDILGQLIVSMSGGSYAALPYCNAFTILLATCWAFLFPPIKRKNCPEMDSPNEKTRLIENSAIATLDFHDKNHHNIRATGSDKLIIVSKQIWLDFETSLSNTVVLKKSVWYILGMASYIQILNNMNVLYSYVVNKQSNNNVLANGFAESMVTLCSALGAFLIGKVQLDWTYHGDVFTAFSSTAMGALIMSCYFYNNLLFIYLTYILFGLISEAILVITLSELGKHLKSQCYSLILGFNLLGSLLMSAIMTLFFVQINILSITVPGRFLFIGGLYVILGFVFFIIHLFENVKKK